MSGGWAGMEIGIGLVAGYFAMICRRNQAFPLSWPYFGLTQSSCALNFDLHCHSNISDGVLSPADLVRRASEKGVDVLALTDHDDVAGLAEAAEAARSLGMRFINGVEISVTWSGVTLHVVGLNVRAEHPDLQAGLAGIQQGRRLRAERMALDLAKKGIPGALDGALQHAANPRLIGRTHFARFLVEQGVCKDVRSVFKKYLVRGRPGYAAHEWTTLENAVNWIRASGGQAVLAHPGRYDLKGRATRRLLAEFKALGGEGVEVVTGSHTPDQHRLFAELAAHFGLLASRGSDFHAPGEYRELGGGPDLPANCTPIWHNWKL
jgi:3',5'-nucleoside bisphosphate phosphatase